MPERVLVGIPSVGGIDARFFACAMDLARPPGTAIAVPPRAVTDVARNALAGLAIDRGFDVLAFIDDDMTFPPDILLRLLGHLKEHPEFDVVAALAHGRAAPHYPLSMRRRPDGRYDCIQEHKKGLVEVDATATCGMVIRTSIFRKLPEPWFRYLYRGRERWTEDVGFCELAREHGYRIAVDTDLEMGHLADRRIVTREDYERASAKKP